MAAVNSAMRLNLAAASDPGNYDENEKTRAAAYMAALQQPSPTPLSLGEEVCVLYATSLGLLDGPVAAAGEVGCVPLLRHLLEYVDAAEPFMCTLHQTLPGTRPFQVRGHSHHPSRSQCNGPA